MDVLFRAVGLLVAASGIYAMSTARGSENVMVGGFIVACLGVIMMLVGYGRR